jgi:hypothetical protein
MKNLLSHRLLASWIPAVVLASGTAVFQAATFQAAAAAASPGLVPLFNGKDLTGWYGLQRDLDPRKLWATTPEERSRQRADAMADFQKHWRVENGELVNDGDGPYATTDKEYGDVEFFIEYRTVAQADSGIYMRGTPQIQIWDYTKDGGKWNIGADKGSGGLWNNSPGAPGKDPLVRADKPFGQWNAMRVLQVGDKTSVWLNGKLVVDHAPMENYWDRKQPLFPRGPIELQTHGGEIRWRNIRVHEIGADEANRILQARDDHGFKPIFNGRDLSGWKGPIGEYEVKDGAIVCKPEKGGTIYYAQELTNFVARLEFKLPPGGNNGLAIRYPGEGDTAYVGMCEVQILDNPADQYKELDPRQYCGSAYGMVAAHREFVRPAGQWNYMEVTVKGSTIKVELNGVAVVNADLAKVTNYMANSAHPGKNRASGFFGFAGHNDPVAYRHVRIKRLD